ncbi:protein KRI1 [Biomphalaria glabrata]|uniref:Protein KRI1 homolog n=1 Tax=Biomphalaria glabrata TaxID=6526 RepID=A0A9U8EA75_BIOGL|nr:protein KRI1 homolog [Biomphalaria glabrata]
MDLLAGDSDEEDQVEFKINENYAKNYEKWRKKEEKQKLLDRYGDADFSDSSSEDEIRSTPQMDKDWLRAYAVVRFQQSRLYKEGEKFFKEEAKPVSKKKEKATTLKDHERKFLLEKAGIESDEESKPKQPAGKSYFEEQEEIKQSFKEVLNDSSDEEEGLLVRKEKTLEEKKKEENDYLEWIKGMKDELDDKEAASELAPLKAYWNDPNLSEKEKVLRDYILNNGYIDQEDSSEESDEEDRVANLPNFEAEEDFLEKAEEYEHKYNFRHEEPGGDEIKSYPRVIETSVRTKDTRRADKRQRKLDKKRLLKEQRKEEIRLLQKIQIEERKEKLEKLRQIADRPDLDYDLEADFDPDEHNKLMQKYFDEDYYGEDGAEAKKPEFEYDAAVDDEPDDWWKERINEEQQGDGENEEAFQEGYEEDYEPGVDDPDFVMDADYDPTHDYKAEKKKNKKKKGLVEKLPVFDPTKKTFDEYIEEYLKDKIDSLPFTYREVVPNDYGLSTEEILKAPERELNSWVSVKKMSQYKSKQEELAERRKFHSRAKSFEKKVKILPSLLEPKEAKKKKKKKSGASESAVETAGDQSLEKSLDEERSSEGEKQTEETVSQNESVSKIKSVSKNESVSKKLVSTQKERKRKACLEDSDMEIKRQKLSQDQDSSNHPEKKKKKKGDKNLTDVFLTDKQTNARMMSIDDCQVTLDIRNNNETLTNNKDPSECKNIQPKSKIKKKVKHLDVLSPHSKDHSVSKDVSRNKIKEKVVESPDDVLSPSSKAQSSTKQLNLAISTSPEVKKTNKMESDPVPTFSSNNTQNQSTDPAKKTKKKRKKKSNTENATEVKKKKKKISIKNFSAADKMGENKTLDSRQLERQLSKVMSAARLSKYGLGPNAVKMKKKKKKQKQ